MVDVYYPYIESEAKWQELKYSLHSLAPIPNPSPTRGKGVLNYGNYI